MYHYRAELIRVVDGDTVDLRVDMGFRLTTVQRFRLLGYDAPEMHGATREMGERAQAALAGLLGYWGEAAEIEIATEKGDSFGRWLCRITITGGIDVAQYLIDLGYGRPWDGKGKRPAWNPNAVYPKSRA